MKTILCTLTAAACLLAAPLARAETVTIEGSNTFGEKLAPTLIEAFLKKNPGWDIRMTANNSGDGIRELLEGACDIAASSRALNEDEYRMIKARGLRVNTHSIAYYGLAIIVNQENPIRNLTDHQVRDIFTGVVTNWSAVGGPNAPIFVQTSTPNVGTYLGFQELAMERRPYLENALQHDTYDAIASSVSENPNAVGYIAMSMLNSASVRALSINGIAPNPVTLGDNQYPYARLLRLVTVKGKSPPAALKFIRFTRSAAGQNLIEANGFVRRFQRHLSPSAEVP